MNIVCPHKFLPAQIQFLRNNLNSSDAGSYLLFQYIYNGLNMKFTYRLQIFQAILHNNLVSNVKALPRSYL